MKRIKKLLLIALALLMVMSLVACNQTGDAGGEDAPEENNAGQEDSPDNEPDLEEVPSVAIIVPGPINDMGWNSLGFQGVRLLEEQYGAKISYTENVSESDAEGILRDYGTSEFEVVFVHGAIFQDAMVRAAQSSPDTTYILTSGFESDEPNIASIEFLDKQQGFLMGVFSALMTESDIVGVIGGIEIPPIANSVKGFTAGVEYIDPDITVLSTMSGTVEDASDVKEIAFSQIDQGADYVSGLANQAGLGALQATAERGVYSVGAYADQFSVEPRSVVTSVAKDVTVGFDHVYKKILDGTIENKAYEIGAAQGSIYFTPYHDFADMIPADVQERIDEIVADLIAGEIDIQI